MAASSTNKGEWYTIDCSGYKYTLPMRYQDPKLIGHGAFGSVIRATDTETGRFVAIKKMLHPFQTPIHAKRTYRELKLLTHLNHPDAQVVQLLNVFTPERNLDDFQTLYFVLNSVDYGLDSVIRHHKPFTEEHIQYIIYPLLRGLKFIHSGGIIHADLKPSNIRFDRNSNVTILGFGSGRDSPDAYYSDYVGVRWYHSPEVIFGQKEYSDKIDIWPIGCIMAELILRRPVFRGSDSVDQLNRIFDIIGTPNLATLNEICTSDIAGYISGLPPRSKQDFNELFGFKYDSASQEPISGVSPEGVDLLDRLLLFDYRLRPTAEEALAHPFFASLYDRDEEPTVERMVDEHEGENYTVIEWKSIIWQMVQEFSPPSWAADVLDDDS